MPTLNLSPSPSPPELRVARDNFEAIMRTHNQRLFRIARSILKSDAEAEDVVQLAYLSAYSKLDQLAESGSLGAWLGRITANKALDRMRKLKRDQKLNESHRAFDESLGGEVSFSITPEDSAVSGELRAVLERAIDSLPEQLRSVLVMRDVEGMSGAETAASLSIEEGAVRVRLHRARTQLRGWLGRQAELHLRETFSFAGDRCDRIVARTLERLAELSNPTTVLEAET